LSEKQFTYRAVSLIMKPLKSFLSHFVKIPLNPPLPVYDRKKITKGG